MKFLKTRNSLAVLCLAALVAMTGACIPGGGGGGNNGGNNGNNANNGGDTGVMDDTGMGEDTGSSEDTGTSDDTGTTADTGTSDDTGTTTDTGTSDDTGTTADTGTSDDTGTTGDAGGTCDVNGFTQGTTGAEIVEDGASWEFFGRSDNQSQFAQLILNKGGSQVTTGTLNFQDAAPDDSDNILYMGDGCTQSGCSNFYQAIGGSVNITTFDQTDGGSFAATLQNVELVEVEFDQNTGAVTRVTNGLEWCISSADLTATANAMEPFTASCDNDGFTVNGEKTVTRDGTGPLFAEATSATTTPNDVLSVQIYPSFPGAATSAGTYQIDDYSFASCANCVLIRTDCDSSNVCQKTFIAGEGTLDVSSFGQSGDTFTATLTDAKLAEVDIDPQSYDTELVQNGEGWCISSISWDMAITTP